MTDPDIDYEGRPPRRRAERCRLFHNWGRWSLDFTSSAFYQSRQCERCGKRQSSYIHGR